MIQRLGTLLTVIGILGGLSPRAFAWPPIFGGEWEFTDQLMQVPGWAESSREINIKKADLIALTEAMCVRTGSCHSENGNRFIYNDGWWFQISTDPGTIEIQSKPEPNSRIEELEQRIQRDVYESAQSLGLATFSEAYGGGHIHIDLESSGMNADPLLLRNFIVDFFNHHEMSSGVLEDDDSNAPAISLAPDSVKRKLREIVEQFDQSGRTKHDAQIFTDRIESEIYDDDGPGMWAQRGEANDKKYQALNLKHMTGLGTLEIRSIRMQRNSHEYLLLTRLFEARINYLKKLNKPVPLQNLKVTDSVEVGKARFRRYVVDSGLNWRDYERMLSLDYQSTRIDPLYSGAPHSGLSDREYTVRRALARRGLLGPGRSKSAACMEVLQP